MTVLNKFTACSAGVRQEQGKNMETTETTYKVAGIDVHKSMLAVVVADAAREGEFQFERRKFGATDSQLCQPGDMAGRTGRAGSGDGVHGTVLEAGVAAVGGAV